MQNKALRIALVGNPNSGKTTIFNNITGTRQKVGNWPGVTVEKKEGRIQKFGYDLTLIDLPGTYSLTPFSIEEIVARNYILDEQPDVVIDIIDSSNLERSLYLATQLRELDCKVLFALNMYDLARIRGIKIDNEKLSELLDLPVVFTVGNKNEGIDTLLQQAISLAELNTRVSQKRKVKYSQDIEKAILCLEQVITPKLETLFDYNSRWVAIKLLENDQIVKERIQATLNDQSDDIFVEVQKYRRKIMEIYDDDPEIVMTDERYGFIAGIIKEVMSTSVAQRRDMSRSLDLVLTHRFLGFPIFIFFIWAMFQLTFSLGSYPMEGIESIVTFISKICGQLMPNGILKELLVDGIIAGVGSVVVFLPNILILFFCISIFEDTGYMARAAFLMDKIMHLIGLHGKSFIPMLMGFGCNVPAIMATRTLESQRDRLLTMLITPFMSCSARLPIYIVLAGTFFREKAGTVIFGIYLLGILMAIFTGRFFRSTILKGADAPFVMELPPYRIPMLKSLLIHMWDRSKMFLKKMGGIILIGSIVIWVLSAFPRNIHFSKNFDAAMEQVRVEYSQKITKASNEQKSVLETQKKQEVAKLIRLKKAEQAEQSYMGMIGKFVSPVFEPIGFDWKGSIAILSGFVAKEIVVSTLGILYAVDQNEQEALQSALSRSGMTPVSALAMMAFVLLYIPCLATISAIRRESGGMKWTLLSIGYSTVVAWLIAFAIFQIGTMITVS